MDSFGVSCACNGSRLAPIDDLGNNQQDDSGATSNQTPL
jgi:hypothetical protein